MTSLAPDGRPLIGSVVRMDRTVAGDADELFAALDDARVYEFGYGGGPAGRPADVAAMRAVVRWRRQQPRGVEQDTVADTSRGRLAYTVRLVADSALGGAGTVVGTSSLGDPSLPDERIHLGWTGYSPSLWGTAVNPECKLLLLTQCFEVCGFGRVKIQTDVLNIRSQSAIARLGAVREGVLRRYQVRADGTFRDTAVFSILASEWRVAKAGLLARLR